MNALKIFILKHSNRLISLLLSLLGFGAVCSFNGCAYGDPIAEYGTPSATFRVKGLVTSEATANPVPHIRVVMGRDTAYTDASGHYEVSNEDFPKDQTFPLEFKDIDAGANGDYETLDTVARFVDPDFTGGDGHWYSGETEKVVDVRLSEKK